MIDKPVSAWRILIGLALAGFLLALPGGLLPLWGYHIRSNFSTAANYFLALGFGIAVGAAASFHGRQLLAPARMLTAGCAVAAIAVLVIAFCEPPAPVWFQCLAVTLAGVAASTVSTAVFEALAPAYEANRARVVLQGGIFFGIGSIFAAWLLAQCLDSTSPSRILALTALLPAALSLWFSRLPLDRPHVQELPLAQAIQDLRTVLAILFALLLFFQFANEWSIAGWLPVFLIDRLGMSPAGALTMLALYWTALTAGRAVTVWLLTRVSHMRILAASAFCALFGCAALRFAGTTFGVIVAILLTGAGFSAIYPLAVERISTRFSYYHPGYFNGIFTFAMLGGILAPFLLGHGAAQWGIEIVPLIAMAGSCAVFGLILIIWLGRKVSGS